MLKPEVDKISGDTTRKTSEEAVFVKLSLMGANRVVGFQIAKFSDKTYALWLSITTPKTDDYYLIDAGSKLFLKLVDKTLVTLTTPKANLEEKKSSNTSTYGSGEGLKTHIIFPITKEELEKLAASDLEFLRIETSRGNKDFDISGKLADRLKKTSLLILK